MTITKHQFTLQKVVSESEVFDQGHLLQGKHCTPCPSCGSPSYVHFPTQFSAAGQALYALPIMWLALYVHFPTHVSLKPFFGLKAFEGAVQMLPILMSATADVVEPSLRASVFSILMALMGLTFAIGPALGATLSRPQATAFAVVMQLCLITATLLFMPGALTQSPSSCTSVSSPPRCCSCLVRHACLHRNLMMCAPVFCDQPFAASAETLPRSKRALGLSLIHI